MSYDDVLDQINDFIQANGTNAITADVLRPILVNILGQPNELIGSMDDSTVAGDTLIQMINALNSAIGDVSGITIYTGADTPLISPPVTFTRGDFFAQISGPTTTISFWQYTGLAWIEVRNYINDLEVSEESTWSSSKIQSVINLKDEILSIIPPTYAAGFVTIQANASWRIGGIIYTNPANVVKAVSNATTGMYRTDLLVANQLNSFDVIVGVENASIQLPPLAPPGTLAVMPINVYGSDVTVPDPIVGEFVKKIEFAENYISGVSGDLNLPLDTEVSNFRILDPIDSITGFDTTGLFNSSNSYVGKEIRIINNSGDPFVVAHDSGASEVPIRFPSEVDFTLNDKEVLVARLVKTDTLVAEFISISRDVVEISDVPGLQDELDSKLDAADYNDRFKGKYTSLVNLEAAYPFANDGDYAIVDTGSGSSALEYIWDTDEGWVKGNEIGPSTTDALAEGSSNLYFTVARVLATLLTGLSASSGTFTSSDSLLTAFGKIKYLIDNIATTYQAILVSGTNIKTLNGFSLLGSGNLTVGGGLKIQHLHWATYAFSALNTWRSWGIGISTNSGANTSYGTGTLPTTLGLLYGDTPVIAINGSKQIKRITLNIRLDQSVRDYQAYIVVADYSDNRGNEINAQVLVNQTFTTGASSSDLVDFTINTHSDINDNSVVYVFFRQTAGSVYQWFNVDFNLFHE